MSSVLSFGNNKAERHESDHQHVENLPEMRRKVVDKSAERAYSTIVRLNPRLVTEVHDQIARRRQDQTNQFVEAAQVEAEPLAGHLAVAHDVDSETKQAVDAWAADDNVASIRNYIEAIRRDAAA